LLAICPELRYAGEDELRYRGGRDELLANCPVPLDKEGVVELRYAGRERRPQICRGSGDELLANCPVQVDKEGVVRAEIRRRGKTSSGIERR
jgi:hypothetical protein